MAATPSPRPARLTRGRSLAASVAVAVLGLQVALVAPAAAAVGFENPSPSVVENNVGRTQVTFTVTRASTDDATIDYQTVDGTATAGADYVARDGTITFEPAQTSRALTVDVLGDLLDEGDETFTLRLSGDGFDDVETTATIVDNDPLPAVSISDVGVIDEHDTGTNPASFFVRLSRPSGRTVTVDYATTTGGTAAAGSDYTAASGSVVFNPGQTSATAQVGVLGDTVDEANETFNVALSLPAGEATATIADGTATGTIIDDDGTPSLSVNDVTVGEAGGKATFTVTLAPASGQPVAVHVSTIDGTATAPSDFTAVSNQRVEIPAGATTATFEVAILNDTPPVAEPSETFAVRLFNATNALVGDGMGTGTITDDDTGPSLSISDVTLPEGNLVTTAFQFKVTRTGATTLPVSFTYETVDGTAVSPEDFTGRSDTGTFVLNSSEATIVVPVAADPLAEADETFTVRLTHATNANIGDGEGLGTIQNDDGPPGILAIADSTVGEGASQASFRVSVVRPVNKVMTVRYTTEDGSATDGDDYTKTVGTITFGANSTAAQTVTVPIRQDAFDEDDETFTLELTDPVNAIFENGDASGAGVIADDDNAPELSITAPSPGVAEGAAGDLRVGLSGESGKTVTVTLTLADDSAVAGFDYAPLTKTVTFAPGEIVKDVATETSPDDLDEDDEVFRVRLSGAVNGTVPAALATPGQAVTIIDNDDPPAVRVSPATIEEANARLAFTVTLDAPSGKAVTVQAATADGTATVANNDYETTTGTLSFAAGTTVATFLVEVNGDSTDENDEAFTVTLSNPVNASLAADGTSATGTILDNDGPRSVSVVGTTVVEGAAGGTATLIVRVLPFADQQITVSLSTLNGTATSPADYQPKTNETVTFAAGESVKNVGVTIVDDTVDEADETFKARLADATGGAGIGTAEADVTITDDDGPLISAAGFSFREADSGTGSATFAVTLSAPSTQTVKVSYATSAGTASAPADFTSVAGNLTFAPGEGAKTVGVQIAGDTLDEADEDFFLTLSGAVNGTAGNPARAVIVDNDQPDVSVGAGGGSVPVSGDPVVTEGNAGVVAMTFAVRLSAPTARDVSVDYTVGGGTANGVADYRPLNGRVTFAPGEISKDVVVPIKGDVLDEADETVVLSVTAPANGTIVDPTAVGTIVDDDEPGYAFVATDGGMFTFGAADFVGSTGDRVLNKPIVGMSAHPSGRGYWLVASDGGIFAFGDAPFKGSTGDRVLNRPIVGMAAHPSGNGYWLVAEDGGIFAFGDAKFQGSTGDRVLNKPIVGMAAHPSGNGYWLVATDGGIFAFGDAKFQGSTGDRVLNKPIVGMAAHPSGNGYWLVATDGGIFAFNAPYKGSTGDRVLNKPIVGMAAHPSGDGYWLVATDGGIFAFNAPYLGSTGDRVLNKPVKGMAVL